MYHLPVPACTTVCSLQHLGCTILHKRSRGCVEPATYRVHTSLPGLVVTLSQADACHCLASSTGCYLRSSVVPLSYSPNPNGGGSNSAGGPWERGLPPTGASVSLLQLPKAPMAGRKTPAKSRPFSDLYHLLQCRRSSPLCEKAGQDVGIRAGKKSQPRCASQRKAVVGAAPPLFHPRVPDPTFLPIPREGEAS